MSHETEAPTVRGHAVDDSDVAGLDYTELKHELSRCQTPGDDARRDKIQARLNKLAAERH